MALAIRRTEADGTKKVIAFVDDWDQVGAIVYDDRQTIDWEASYLIEPDEEEQNDAERNDP